MHPYPSGDDFTKIIFVDSTTGFLLGRTDLMKTSDKGITWKKNDNSSSYNFDIFFLDKENGWLSSDNKLLRTSDCGESWETINDSISGTVQFMNRNHGWLFDNRAYASCRIYETTDGGLSWNYLTYFSEKYTGNSYQLTSFQFLDSLNGFACGGSMNDYGYIYKTINGGKDWIKIDTLPDILYKIAFVNDSVGYITGQRSMLLKTSDGGITWNRLVFSPETLSLVNVSFFDEKNGAVIDRYGFAGTTIDGGLNWTIHDFGQDSWYESGNDYWLSGVTFLNKSNLFVCGNDGLLVNRNKYQWEPNFKAKFGSIYGVHFIDEKKGFIASEYGLFYTTAKEITGLLKIWELHIMMILLAISLLKFTSAAIKLDMLLAEVGLAPTGEPGSM
jgi:photosystem II stability/assembly factor-like uncharacterized protein